MTGDGGCAGSCEFGRRTDAVEKGIHVESGIGAVIAVDRQLKKPERCARLAAVRKMRGKEVVHLGIVRNLDDSSQGIDFRLRAARRARQEHLVAVPMRHGRRADLDRLPGLALTHEYFDGVRFGPLRAQILAEEVFGPRVIAEFHEGGRTRSPRDLRVEENGGFAVAASLLDRAGIAERVTQKMVGLCVVRPSANQVPGLLQRSSEIASLDPVQYSSAAAST